MRSRFILFALAMCAIDTTGCAPTGSANPPTSIGESQPAPPRQSPVASLNDEIKLQTLDYAGVEKLIAGHRGKIVVVDFWSTACPPCVKEFPQLLILQNRIGKERLAGVSLSLDYDGSDKLDEIKPRVLEFLHKKHAALDNVLCSEEADVVCKKAEIAAIPAVFVYDRDGKLRERVTESKAVAGKGLYARVNELVDELLADRSL